MTQPDPQASPDKPVDSASPRPESVELVAYLDGELDDVQLESVENRLRTDPVYREHLKQFQQSWDLLDDLQAAEPDATFTQSTVALVALSAGREAGLVTDSPTEPPADAGASARSRPKSFRRVFPTGLRSAGLVVLTALAGFLFVSTITHNRDRQLLRNLGLINNLDLYLHVDSLDILRSLQATGLFADPVTATRPFGGTPPSGDANGSSTPRQLDEWRRVDAMSLEGRRDYVQSLGPAAVIDLRKKYERFRKLGAEQRTRVEQLHRNLLAAEDRDALWPTLLHFHEWLKTLTAAQRAELSALQDDAYVTQTKRLWEQQEAERFQRISQSRLRPEDHRQFIAWLVQYATEHEAEIGADLPPALRERLEEAPPPLRRYSLIQHLGRRHPESFRPTAESINELIAELSPEPARLLEQLDHPRQEELLRRWLKAAAVSRGRLFQSGLPPRIDAQRLQRFFLEELSPDQRKYLESLAPDRMRRELLRLFWMQQRKTETPPP